MGYYGSLDLTKLGQIVRQHPELVKTVNMKDGTTHQFINVDVNEKQQTDQYGNTAYLKVACKRDNQKQGLNYYLCDMKPSQNNQQQPAQQSQQTQHTPASDGSDGLPF